MARFIYLDHAATTAVQNTTAQIMCQALVDTFGNPSSPHSLGVAAERLLKQARQGIARSINAPAGDVYFTSGGTEADNLAIRGTLETKQRRGRHVVASAIEHEAILETLRQLKAQGLCTYTLVAPDLRGRISTESVLAALQDDTILVSIMLINNETGAIQPVAEITKEVKARAPDIYCHSDAVQALGKLPLDMGALGVDLLTISGHKLGGPKGVGGLYCRRGVRLTSQITGGGQENGLRSGTENVAGILGFAHAAGMAIENLPQNVSRWRRLQGLLAKRLQAIPDVRIHSEPLLNAPHILNVGFWGVRAEVLVHALAQAGVYVSTGAACSSRKHITSHVLEAMAVPRELAKGSIRISFGVDTNEEEIEVAADLIAKSVAELRLFQQA